MGCTTHVIVSYDTQCAGNYVVRKSRKKLYDLDIPLFHIDFSFLRRVSLLLEI